MSIKSQLEKIIDDLGSVESSIVKKTGNTLRPITYSNIQIEGDSINWIATKNKKSKELIQLHCDIAVKTYKCRMAVIKMASSIIDII